MTRAVNRIRWRHRETPFNSSFSPAVLGSADWTLMLIGGDMLTVRDATRDLMRELGLTTIFGNPGSTEETFLQDFPSDFTYVLALQEASAVGMADGYAQAMRRPAFVNLHTAAGLGNAMGCLFTACQNKTPLIVTAGQQTREMALIEPLLTNVDATFMPRPWVKWSYEPGRAEDIPAALMRAYAVALQPPAGPVFLSLPLDDWDKPFKQTVAARTVSQRIAPDPERLAGFAAAIDRAHRPALIYGADIARSQAWEAGVAFAERLRCPVWAAPFTERTPFPETHPQYAGALPAAIGPLSEQLEGHDLAIVIGAPVFRYYPYVPGRYLPRGASLLHVTDNPAEAARAPVGDSLLGDARLTLEALLGLTSERNAAQPLRRRSSPETPRKPNSPMSADDVFALLSRQRPDEFVLVQESPSNAAQLRNRWPIGAPDSFYTFSSGGLGWDMPAAAGLALAERESGRNRPVIAVMGDGSFQYSVQSLWTAAQHNLHVIYVALRNGEYGILKSFAVLERTPGVPGLDIPGIDIAGLGQAYGCRAARAGSPGEVNKAFHAALEHRGPTVIEIPVSSEVPALI